MNTKELKAEEQNLQATISQLKAEADQAAAALSSLLITKNNAAEDTKKALADLETAKAGIARDFQSLEDAKEAFRQRHKEREQAIQSQEQKLDTLRIHEKDSNKALQKLNGWILAAEEEKRALEVQISRLNQILEQRDILVSQVSALAEQGLALQREIMTLGESRDFLRLQIAQVQTDAQAELKATEDQIAELKRDAQSWIAKRSTAENDFIRFNDEYKKKKDDLQIIVGRIESKWNETFPDLKFPL